MPLLLRCLLCGHQIASDATFCPNCGKRDAGIEAFKRTWPDLGTVFSSHVTMVEEFGVFVALPNGGEGFVHLSELSNQRIKNVSDVTSVGSPIRVRIVGIDGKNRARLTAKLND